jgi:hypothetical protein
MITATDLLDFLCKAQKLSPSSVSLHQTDEGYKISLYLDWCDNNHFYTQSIFVDNEGRSDWQSGDYDFDTMNNMLDTLIQIEQEKEIKAQKRKELIESLTPEQRDLLGV